MLETTLQLAYREGHEKIVAQLKDQRRRLQEYLRELKDTVDALTAEKSALHSQVCRQRIV